MTENIINNMSTKKVEEVALYIRVSSEEQAVNGDSLRTQRDELTKYALENNYHIHDIYEDNGYSATNLNRPALQGMLEDVKLKKINRILITKLDRLSRGVRNYYKILDTLDENNVFWSTIFEKYDSSTANGRLHINIMLSVAENESAQTGERIRSVFKTKVNNKEIISGKIQLGYKKEGKKLVVDEDKRQFVIDTFNYYLKSGSIYKTFNYLTANYFDMNYDRTLRMLRNKIYIGTKVTRYGEIENFCEPIIDKGLFNKVQTLLKKNERKRTHKNNSFIFSRMLKCANCGYKLSGKFHHLNKQSIYYYYLCNHARFHKTCNMLKFLNESKIEKKLLEIIVPEINKYLQQFEYSEKKIKVKNTSNEKSNINKKLEKLRDLYVRDMIQIEHYESEYNELTKQLELLNNQEPIKKENNINTKTLQSFLSETFISTYKKLSRDEKRLVWASVIDTIHIDHEYNIRLVFI